MNRMCLAADVPLIESGTAGYLGQVTVIKKVPQNFFCHILSTVVSHLWQELHSKDNLQDAKSPKYLNKYLFIPIITDVLMAETSLHTFSDFI